MAVAGGQYRRGSATIQQGPTAQQLVSSNGRIGSGLMVTAARTAAPSPPSTSPQRTSSGGGLVGGRDLEPQHPPDPHSLKPGRDRSVRVRTRRDWASGVRGITTTGAILSSFESEQVNVLIHVVYYNSAGEVVGGAVAQVEHVPPGGQIAFEADTSVTVPEIAETRVFGHIGFGD